MLRNLIVFALFLVMTLNCSQKESVSTQEIDPAVAQEKPRFDLMSPDQTGITFVNKIQETWDNNVLTNQYLYNGGGVGVLDVNNDELPDLYFTATDGTDKLYLNKGGLKFEDLSEKAGISNFKGIKSGIAVVDINADGWEDLYVCRTGLIPGDDRKNLLFINNKNNTFTESAKSYGLDDLGASNHANFFDYDLDGDLDCYVINFPTDFKRSSNMRLEQLTDGSIRRLIRPDSHLESDHLYRNNGNGTFSDVSVQAGIINRTFGLSVNVSDLNNDGWPDVYIANDYIDPDHVWINNKNGTFTDQYQNYIRHTGHNAMGADIADVNNDGLVDIYVCDMMARDNFRQKILSTPMVNDRYETLVKYNYGHQIMRNMLQLNNGNGTFSEVGCLTNTAFTDWSWGPLLADFNNDGWKDIYVTNGYRRDITNEDYVNFFLDSINKTGGVSPQRFKTVYEFLDKIPSQKLANFCFKNNGDGNFYPVQEQWGLNQPSYSNGCGYADLDKDGDLDIIVSNIDHEVYVYKNLSNSFPENNWLQIKAKGSPKNPNGVGLQATIQIDGQRQYLEMTPNRGFFSSSQNILHFGLGKSKMIDSLWLRWPDGKVEFIQQVAANQVLIADYSKSKPGKVPVMIYRPFMELVVAGFSSREQSHVENEFDDFTRERLLPRRMSRLGPAIATADLNGDGFDEVYLGGAKGQTGSLWTQNANGTWSKMSTNAFAADSLYEDTGAFFTDIDKDKDLDLIVLSGGNEYEVGHAGYQVRLYTNQGSGNFILNLANLPNLRESCNAGVSWDYDKDGDNDLLIFGRQVPGAYPLVPNSHVLQNNNGQFNTIQNESTEALSSIGMVTDAIVTDLEKDGQMELILTGEWMPVTILQFKNGKFSKIDDKFKEPLFTGWWDCVAAADLDGDGDIDLATGNLGQNTRYRVSPTKPLELWAKDYDGNGSIDPIMTVYEGQKCYPVHTRNLLLKQLPPLKKKFVFTADYARATIDEIYSNGEREGGLHLVANEFRSGWWENINGVFEFHAFPFMAQMSPVKGIVVDDLNKDGIVDMLLVGNDYGTEVETSRYDAGNGCVLQGLGKGKFKPLPVMESGFFASGDARRIARVRLVGGKSGFLVANNNGPAQLFQVKSTLPLQ